MWNASFYIDFLLFWTTDPTLLFASSISRLTHNIDTGSIFRKCSLQLIEQLWILDQKIIWTLRETMPKTQNFRYFMPQLYIKLYGERHSEVLEEYGSHVQKIHEYTRTSYTTWKISYDQLMALAKTFLQLCSFLHHRGIYQWIFKLLPWNLQTIA